MSENLDLVRSIYVYVERGELSIAKWADPGIEWVNGDGPEPGTRVGIPAMEEGLRAVMEAWLDYRVKVEQYRELDDERVLVFVRRSGRGSASGVEIADVRSAGASLYHIRDGRVVRLVNYMDRDRALADLGLTE